MTLVQSAGSGLFLTSNAIFLTRYAGLSPFQVGLGLAVAGFFGFAATVPLGRLADRTGAQPLLFAGYGALAVLFVAYCFVGTFAAFVVVASLISICETSASPLRAALLQSLFSGPLVVRVRAQMRSAFNLGYMLGAAASGGALAVGSVSAFFTVLIVNAAAQAACVVMTVRLKPTSVVTHKKRGERRRHGGALRDRPFLALTAVNGFLELHYTVFTVGIPLWIVSHTDAPSTLNSVLLITGTVLVIVLQLPMSRNVDTLETAATVMRRGGFFMAVSCALFAASGVGGNGVAISFMLIATVLLAIGEVAQSAGSWGISFGWPPADRQGEYQSVYGLGRGIREFVGPALMASLIVPFGWKGWIALGGIFFALSFLPVPLVRAGRPAQAAEIH
ncbi:MFS transporter [Streptomyces alboflavus]|uniref:MFS transporter n=1 Tax=Streptomyces alboflavus TaxID=67267 RepID=UPI001386EBEB|nr:MFS transporter [Streptomyces alboflavus]